MAAQSEVVSTIESARNFALDSFSSASSLVDQAVSIANGFAIPNVPDFQSTQTPEQLELPVVPPEFTGDVDLTGIDRPESPDLEPFRVPSIPDFDDIQRPAELDFDSLFQQDTPVFDLQPFDRDAPQVSDPDMPDAPSLNFPDAPQLRDISFPDEPSVSLPVFDPQGPQTHPELPEDFEEKYDLAYRNLIPELRDWIDQEVDRYTRQHSPRHYELMTKLEDRLARMMDGGTALPEDIEQQIHDRARARNEAERANVEAEAAGSAARRGHTMPSGAMAAALQRAAEQAMDANVRSSSEIAIEQARMEQQNIQFALQTQQALRQMIINGALQYASLLVQANGQALEYARNIAQQAVELFNAQVRLFEAEVRWLQAQAQVYETELRASLAELEKFQALVRVEELKSQINTQLVEQYRLQIRTEQTRIEMYVAQLQAVSQQIQVDQTRIQGFRAEVEAYSATVGAKELEFRAYQAALRGDEAKVRGYLGQLQAFQTEIEAERTKTQADIAVSEAVGNFNRTTTEVFRTEMAAYGIDINARTSVFDSELRAYAAELDRYQAEVRANVQVNQSQLESARLDFERARQIFSTTADVNIRQAESLLQRVGNASQAAISGARVYGDIANGAISAQNSIASIGFETLGIEE